MHVGGRGDRTVGVGGERGGHEQLRPVGAKRALGRGDLGGAEVRERRRTVRPHDQALGVHLPVRDARARGGRPRTCQEPRRSSSSTSSASSEPRVRPFASRTRSASPWSVSPAAIDRHHGHAAPLGGQRDERLVLDLLEPAGPDALRAPMPDRVPRGGHELAVRGIATEDLDEERPTLRRGREGEGHAPRLQRGVPGGGRLDAEFPEHLGHLLEGEPPAGRAEEQVRPGPPSRTRSGTRRRPRSEARPRARCRTAPRSRSATGRRAASAEPGPATPSRSRRWRRRSASPRRSAATWS